MKGKSALVALAGAAVGGVLGHVGAVWLAHQGFYALVLPGAMLGWGGGALAKGRSVLRGCLCALAAVALGLLTDWHIAPFIADRGLSYYLAHVTSLPPVTLLMIAVGGALGGWLGVGRTPSKGVPAASPGPGPVA